MPTVPQLSVIIPALNEAELLPGLLDALAAQTRPPDEVIVADADSIDGTVDIARRHGARVVPGGQPGVGRNMGANAATCELLLFLDADVFPPPGFIAQLLGAFTVSGCDVATCLMEPRSDRVTDRISFDAANLYLQVVQPITPHAPGCCILVRRDLHRRIDGFDASALMAEDHDYVQRAARHGRFAVLTDVRVPVSTRRLEREGLPTLAFKYLWCEMHALTGKPVRTVPFRYAAGTWDGGPVRRRTILDIGELRQQLGRFNNPAQELSTGALERIERLLQQERDGVNQMWWAFDQTDLRTLQRYLRRRRAILLATRRQARQRLAALQTAGRGEWLEFITSRTRGASADAADAAGDD
jgi:glycosyltransferase involved in cell wall biosynthesis